MSLSGISRDSIFTVALAVGFGINVNTYKRAQKRRFFQENVTAIREKLIAFGLSYRYRIPAFTAPETGLLSACKRNY